MQPYFLPYIGYYQLIAAVDVFIVYDNIKYTKKGWINRNRLLKNGKDAIFSLPLKNESDYLNICERELSGNFNRSKLLSQFQEAYRRAPYFSNIFPLVEDIVQYDRNNLFDYIFHSIVKTCAHLGIATTIRKSSDIEINHQLKSKEKVLALCEATRAKTYLNGIGGVALYSKEDFEKVGVDLKFVQPIPFSYPQFGGEFIPWLSIIDVMMFNSKKSVEIDILPQYKFI